MELEIEGFYPRGIFVSKKGGDPSKGAKKKYALIDDKGHIKVKGFELVRRDWSKVAKDTQFKVLETILKEGDKDKAVKIVKDMIERLKKGDVDLEELAIYTQLQKPIAQYAIISPELSAIMKAIQAGRRIEVGDQIGYVITRTGKSISEKAQIVELAKDYDADYYIDHQILPAVMKILKELGYDEDEMKKKGKQTSLEGFF
jgi:DNA polymerase I